jgi:pimeloyl-ACP methyl ester carboxylesterase
MSYWKTDDGTQIYYEVYGWLVERSTLLLLPGLLGTASSQWREFIDPLSESYRLLLIDHRSHGLSDNRENNLIPDRLVQDLVGLLNHLEISIVHVAGYSLGGYLGLLLHLFEPRLVKTILLHGTKYYWTQESATEFGDKLDPDFLSSNAPDYASHLAKVHGAARWRPLVRQAADLVAYLAENRLTDSTLNRVQCPVLVSVGDRDELVPVREAQRLSRSFRQGSLLVLPGVRHPFQSLGLIPLLPVMQRFHKG